VKIGEWCGYVLIDWLLLGGAYLLIVCVVIVSCVVYAGGQLVDTYVCVECVLSVCVCV